MVQWKETKHRISSSVNPYGDYALWFYNKFFNAGASSLMELPLKYKVNLLEYDPEYQVPDVIFASKVVSSYIERWNPDEPLAETPEQSKSRLDAESARLESLCVGYE